MQKDGDHQAEEVAAADGIQGSTLAQREFCFSSWEGFSSSWQQFRFGSFFFSELLWIQGLC